MRAQSKIWFEIFWDDETRGREVVRQPERRPLYSIVDDCKGGHMVSWHQDTVQSVCVSVIFLSTSWGNYASPQSLQTAANNPLLRPNRAFALKKRYSWYLLTAKLLRERVPVNSACLGWNWPTTLYTVYQNQGTLRYMHCFSKSMGIEPPPFCEDANNFY